MSGHTPGPWAWNSKKTCIVANNVALARVWMMRNGQGVANAHMMKAAPDMHACLKSFALNWGEQLDMDEDINGADVVAWLADQWPYWKHALERAEVAE